MAKVTTKEQLAADLARRGGPKKPTNEQRAAASRRVQANPGKPLLYNDQQMIARGARPAGPPQPGPVNRPPAQSWRPPMNSAPPYQGPSRPPAFDVSFQPPPRPISTYQAPSPYRPMTPTTAPGGLPGGAMPQQSGWRPPQPVGMDTGAWRPPMNNAPPAPASDNESLSTFFFSLGRMLGQAWHGTQPEQQQPPKPWLPDLWSLSNR